jgi:hypothetical protein|tara:strand:+ start:186 stop:374 length:189 start_codon:yes stop_codon:yes gene_type:complete
MAKIFEIGDLVETIHYPRHGIILNVVPYGKNKYLPDCHVLVAFIDGLTYWKLCKDLELISKG